MRGEMITHYMDEDLLDACEGAHRGDGLHVTPVIANVTCATCKLIAKGVEAERRRIRTALAAAVLEALRALPEGQAIVRGRIVDGPLAAARLRAAWRESFPLTDEVAQHLREVLAGEVNP